MALEGSIQEFALPDIIQFLRHQNKTGVLTIEAKDSWTKVVFEGGMIVSAVTPETAEETWIGQWLIRTERISESTLKESLKNQGKGQTPSGLIEAGLLTKPELSKLLDLRTKETLYTLLRLKEGRYRFEASPVSYNHDYSIPLDPEFILLEGMRQYDEWPMIENKINNKNMIFEKKPDVSDKVRIAGKVEQALDEQLTKERSPGEDLNVTAEEMEVYKLVDGQRDVQKIIDMVQMGEFNTCKALADLLSKGLISAKGEISIQKEPPEMPVPVREIPAVLKPANLLGILLLGLMIAGILAGWANVIKGIASSDKAMLLLREELAVKQRVQLEEAVLVYYFRNARLPGDLNTLASDLGNIASLVEEGKERGVQYRIQDDGFVLDAGSGL
jgi:hypothetical protein